VCWQRLSIGKKQTPGRNSGRLMERKKIRIIIIKKKTQKNTIKNA
jgi:hypothetical protein